MEGTEKAQEAFTQSCGKAVETLGVWADANQRVLRELAELSAVPVQERLRLYGEVHQKLVHALHDAHALTLRWQSGWPDPPKDPMGSEQPGLSAKVDNAP